MSKVSSLKSPKEYPIDKSPWLPLRYTRIDGEDYGRGFVEEYIGDLKESWSH